MRLKLLVAIVGIYEAAAIGMTQMAQTDIPSGLLDSAIKAGETSLFRGQVV